MPIYKNMRLVSYETLLFDTADGDLDLTEYADDGNGTGYYIHTVPKNQGQFQWIDLNLKDMASNVYKIAGLKKVNIIAGNAYYDEFITAAGITAMAASLALATPSASLSAGHTIRVRTTQKAYDAGRYIKDTPVPSRDEVVAILPPAILGIPPEKQYNAPLLETINEFFFQKSGQHHSIGFNATSNSGLIGAVTSYSFNHTCGATANLLVFGHSDYDGNDAGLTSVTYNAVNLTFIRLDANLGTHSTIYYLLAPATGSAKSVSVTLPSAPTECAGGVVSYSGAKQSGQPDAHNGAIGGTGNPTVVVTTIANNCWVFSVVLSWQTSTSNNTQRWNVTDSSGGITFGGSDTNAPKTPAGDQTMSWNIAGVSIRWAISAASFAPDLPKSKGTSMASKLIAAGIL